MSAKKKAAKASAEENIQRLRATGRNDMCPCGSGKKYKKCHLREDEEAERVHLEKIQAKAAKEAEKAEKEESQDGKAETPKAKPTTPLAAKPAPKGPEATASQRSMPRKAQ